MKELEGWLPKSHWSSINLVLVGFGQTHCLPVGPKCSSCVINDILFHFPFHFLIPILFLSYIIFDEWKNTCPTGIVNVRELEKKKKKKKTEKE